MDDIDDADGSMLVVDATGIYAPNLPLYTAIAGSSGITTECIDATTERIDALEKRVEYLEKLIMDKYMSDMDGV